MSRQYDVDKMNEEIDRKAQEGMRARGYTYSSAIQSGAEQQKSDLSHLMRELDFLREEKKKLDKIEVILMAPRIVKDPAHTIPDWISTMLREIAAVLDGSDEE